MSDLLVKLYDLPDASRMADRLREAGVTIRPAFSFEKYIVAEWVGARFSKTWASECERGFANTPVSTLIALDGGRLIGFACYDCTCRGYFGPMGVDPAQRGRGVGRMLLWVCLKAMWDVGYGYAIIGSAGPVDFYAKAVGATVIEGSTPGIYRGILTSSQV